MSTIKETVGASHILVKTLPEAESLQQKIAEGADFASLAREYSLCPSKRNGGDLGFFRRGQMVKPFEEAVFSLEVDAISEPVITQYGVHLIKRHG